MQAISGFSKLTKLEKIDMIVDHYFSSSDYAKAEFKKYWHADEKIQKTIDEFSENTLTNFHFPMGVVPNVMINKLLN